MTLHVQRRNRLSLNNAVTRRKQTILRASFPPTVGPWKFYFFLSTSSSTGSFRRSLNWTLLQNRAQNKLEIHGRSQTGTLTKIALLWNILQRICFVYVKETCSLFGRPYTTGANYTKIQRTYNLRRVVRDV